MVNVTLRSDIIAHDHSAGLGGWLWDSTDQVTNHHTLERLQLLECKTKILIV